MENLLEYIVIKALSGGVYNNFFYMDDYIFSLIDYIHLESWSFSRPK
jgi:hypothetical protein